MAKKSEKKSGSSARRLLEGARKHQAELQSRGLHASLVDKLEAALGAVESEGKGPNAAAQTLMKDITGLAAEFQAAMRKEFPGNAQFQAFFKAGEPMPSDARGILALGRQIVANAPDFAANLIRYALDAAKVKHVASLSDQLEREIGGADPKKDAAEAEQQLRDFVKSAYEGQPQMSDFE
jgi:hypothetical protein